MTTPTEKASRTPSGRGRSTVSVSDIQTIVRPFVPGDSARVQTMITVDERSSNRRLHRDASLRATGGEDAVVRTRWRGRGGEDAIPGSFRPVRSDLFDPLVGRTLGVQTEPRFTSISYSVHPGRRRENMPTCEERRTGLRSNSFRISDVTLYRLYTRPKRLRRAHSPTRHPRIRTRKPVNRHNSNSDSMICVAASKPESDSIARDSCSTSSATTA